VQEAKGVYNTNTLHTQTWNPDGSSSHLAPGHVMLFGEGGDIRRIKYELALHPFLPCQLD